jgi:hypothetical protein
MKRLEGTACIQDTALSRGGKSTMKRKLFGIGLCAMALLALSGCPAVPAVDVSSSFYDFGTDESEWEFEVWNSGEAGSRLEWYAEADKDWILLANKSGTSNGPNDRDTIRVRIDRDQFLADEKKLQANGTITVYSERGGIKEVTVKVSELIAELGASPSTLNFGTSDDILTFQVFNKGDTGTTLTWAASADEPWISLSQRAGTINSQTTVANVNVTVDRDNFTFSKAQTWSGTITVTATDQDPIEIQVLVTVLEPDFGFSISDDHGSAGSEYQIEFETTTSVYDFKVWNDGDSGSEIRFNFDVTYFEEGGIATADPDPEAEWLVLSSQVGGNPITHVDSLNDTAVPVYVSAAPGPLGAGTWYAAIDISTEPDTVEDVRIICVLEIAKTGWIKAFALPGEDAVTGLSETKCGGILVEGAGACLTLDADGKLVACGKGVKAEAPALASAETADGGLITATAVTDRETGTVEILLRKFGADGAEIFAQRYGIAGEDCMPAAVLPVEDGYIAGAVVGKGADADMLVIRTDLNGMTNAGLENVQLAE